MHHWLSFADESGNLGCAIVQPEPEDIKNAQAARLLAAGHLFRTAADQQFGAAVFKTTRLGFNPGGEVQGATIPDELLPEPEWRDRLLTPTEARQVCAMMDEKAGS